MDRFRTTYILKYGIMSKECAYWRKYWLCKRKYATKFEIIERKYNFFHKDVGLHPDEIKLVQDLKSYHHHLLHSFVD